MSAPSRGTEPESERPPDPPVPPGPAARRTGPAVRRWFASLQTKLATVVVVVLAVGLAVTGSTAWAVLSRSLVGEVDAQLVKVVEPLAQVASHNLLGGLPLSRTETESLPSDYYVLFVSADASFKSQWSSTATGQPRSAPAIHPETLEQVLDRHGEPYTVTAVDGSSRWRVVALPLVGVQGSVAVALPMDALDAASAQLRTVLVVVGGLTALLGGYLGALAVRRSLRPLHEIERTAAAIASGQLDSRVTVTDEHTEVGHLATSLNAMLERLELAFAAREASEERMRRFVADASHELRTPLATVRGYAELYRMGAVTSPEELADTMRRVEESASRMGLLVEDLLVLARLDESASGPSSDEVDLLALAQDAAQDLVALDPGRDVRVLGLDGAELDGGELDGGELDGGQHTPVLVRGDARRLRQVLTNLVGNVAAHTPAGSPCEIAVGHAVVGKPAVGQPEPEAPPSPVVVLEVRDRGPGLAPEHVERIFERFFRSDASRGRGEGGGAGLGLAIVSSIVAAHGGRVDAGSREGGGSVFRVELPPA
ncbi:MAG: HAMP domain-containing histidine kinase [Actinomycetales bacterium]|nr:HAMP domain-containing histidine kinase [Actinomycetales bacterium]